MIYICIPSDSDGRVCLQFRRPVFDPWVGKFFWRRELQATPVFFSFSFNSWESYLENSMDRGAWQPIVHGVTDLDMTEQLTHTYDMFGRTNAFCFKKPCLEKTLRQVNNPGIFLTCLYMNSFWRACDGGVGLGPWEGRVPGTRFSTTTLKNGAICKVCISATGKGQVICVFFRSL